MSSSDSKRSSDSDSGSDSDDWSDLDAYENYEKKINPKNIDNADELNSDFGIKVKSNAELEDDDLFAMDESDEKVEWAAVKPYLGALVPPTKEPRNDPSLPDQDLVLDWAYGYRAYDSRSNLAFNSKGEVVYPTASVVVIYDPKKDVQRFFQGHDDDVICLAQNPVNPDIMATGQVATIVDRRATLPHVCVWNSVTGESWKLPRAGKRAIRSVAFSADGKFLATVDDSETHDVSVWDWEAKKKLTTEKGDTNKIYFVRWNHTGDTSEFVTVGKRHIYFWKFSGGRLKKKKGLMGKYSPTTMATLAFSDKGYACVGSQEGDVYVFVDGKAKKKFSVHKKTIYSIEYTPGGIITGGKDCTVVVLDKKVKPVNKIKFNAQVRSIRMQGNTLFVGLSDSTIFMIDDPANASETGAPLIRGHFDGELWGLAPSPDGRRFATCGEDNMIGLWDIEEHDLLRTGVINKKKGKALKNRKAASTTHFPPNQCARALDWSPDGSHIAVGSNDGCVVIVDGKTLRVLHSVDLNSAGKRKVTGQKENWIQALRYSPDGETLAVGTHGSVICLLDVDADYKCKGTLTSHNAAITHLDWTADGKYLRSCCMGYELLFHKVDTRNLAKSKQYKRGAGDLRDTKWATNTCVLTWPTIGVFDSQQDGTDINCTDTSPSGTLVATGDDYGWVNLFRWPVNETGNESLHKIGHASHVMGVRFTPDGKYLITVGGNDKTVLQWKIVPRQ